MTFKKDFIWGGAAASYQIEGAHNEDGKGMSIWDNFTEKENAVYQGHTGQIACDHYHRYKEDVALMKQVGLQAYRFSISWPRVMPGGIGAINTKGLDFYSRLVDELLSRDIMPFPTLFHWDYPYELYLKGGWLNPDSPKWFAEYTAGVVDRLSDRVGNWFTINEPQVIVGLGHCTGIHAPGLQLQKRELVHVTHNILRSHGAAVETIRARSILPSKAGIAPVCPVAIPVDNGQQNIEAAGAAMFNVTDKDLFTGWSNSWWLDPIFKGEYPEDGLKLAARYLPANFQDHMKSISVPTDFLGNNHYEGIYVSANKDGTTRIHPPKEGEPLTGFNWRVTPEGLYWGPRFLYERYNKPIIITENGLSNKDWVALDGKVHDPQRIDFTQRYLREFQRAAADGVDAAGYFHWSIMDNFEWAFGYKERFGLIHVDFETQKRTLKDSAYWYSDIIKSNGKNL